MAHFFNSWKSQADFDDLERRNSLSTVRVANLKKTQEEIDRGIQLLETCNSQVKQMVSVSNSEILSLNGDVETLKHKTKTSIKNWTASLNSKSAKIEAIERKNQELSNSAEKFPTISFPYDSKMEDLNREIENMNVLTVESAKKDENLKNQHDDLEKSIQTQQKAKRRAEKDFSNLQEMIQTKKTALGDVQKSTEENQKKISQLEEELWKEKQKKEETKKEFDDMNEQFEKLEKTLQEERNTSDFSQKISVLDGLYKALVEDLEIDISQISGVDEEILQLFNELKNDSENVAIAETITDSESALENIQNLLLSTENEIKELEEFSEKHTVTKEILTRKRSGYVDVKRQIVENTSILDGFRVRERAVKPLDSEKTKKKMEEVYRQLEASRNEVPEPEPYKPFQTPTQVVRKKSFAEPWLTKKTSVTADSTRPISVNGPHYPGIHLVASQKVSKGESNKTFNDSIVSDDTSLLSDDSGTTQDDSAIQNFWSPLKNQNSLDVVEFSMADHMKNFTQRQEEKKSTVVEKDADLSMMAPESDEEDNDDDDDDDDLYAPEDAENLDQSMWGSDD